MSKFSFILVLQKKQENLTIDMEKIQIKSEKLTPFGGYFPTEPFHLYNVCGINYYTPIEQKKAPITISSRGFNEKRQLPTLPHCIAVPSAQLGLTSLFEMGRGGTPTQ